MGVSNGPFPTKFHYKKRWPSNGWTKKRNQITCNKEERISPPSYNKCPDAFWTIPLKTKGLCKFDKLETKSKRIFRKSDYIGLIYLARCLRFFLYPCQMQAGWTWYSRWNRIWEWIFSNERSIIDSRLWILEVFFIIQSQLFKNFYRR